MEDPQLDDDILNAPEIDDEPCCLRRALHLTGGAASTLNAAVSYR
jgi:hypothetical protein